MTPHEARALRDEIKATGLHCTIPRGGSLPRIFTDTGEVLFASRAEWLAYKKSIRDRIDAFMDRIDEEYGSKQQSRSPIERLIDEACGLD